MSRREVLPKVNVLTKYPTVPQWEDARDETGELQREWMEAKEERPDVKITSQFVRIDKRGMIREPRNTDRTLMQRREVIGEARAVFGVSGAKLSGIQKQVQTRIDR